MDLGHGYEQFQVREHLIPRRPVTDQPMQESGQGPLPTADPFDDGIESGLPPRSWNPTPSSMEAMPSVSDVPLSDQPRRPLNLTQREGDGNRRLRRRLNSLDDPLPAGTRGFTIQSALQRHFFSWVAYFLAVCFFVFTVIFAWNATGGAKANRRFLFTNPGRTILVLQICSTVTTSLFAESLIASCEMVSSPICWSN